MPAKNAFPRDKHPFYCSPFYPYGTSTETAPVPTAPAPQKYFIFGLFVSTQTPEIPCSSNSWNAYPSIGLNISHLLLTSAQIWCYNAWEGFQSHFNTERFICLIWMLGPQIKWVHLGLGSKIVLLSLIYEMLLIRSPSSFTFCSVIIQVVTSIFEPGVFK